MAYTTDEAVAGIIEVDDEITLTPFIETAHYFVNRMLVPLKDEDDLAIYEEADLELIERWLSAHFYAVRDPRAKSEKAGTVSENFEGETALGFDFTRYGQMAMRLDVTGTLASLNQQSKDGKKRSAGITWLGTAST